MILRILLILAAVHLFGDRGFAQNGQQNWLKIADGSVSFFDKDGKFFVNPYPEIDGSPFFLDSWKAGYLVLTNRTAYSHMQLRLDLYAQEAHFLTPSNTEMVMPKGSVWEILLIDSSAADSDMANIDFEAGFPAVDNLNSESFYRVWTKGKITLLESIRRVISEEKDALSGDTKKQFIEYRDYYCYKDARLQRVKKDKTSILGMMGESKDKVTAYADSHKLNFRSFEDVRKLIDYYNSIP